ncbi:MAG: class I SAM-dependent methyltransferase [Ignavibacteriaceae bacterium]|jgi:predicted O-methyltransferase YrrM
MNNYNFKENNAWNSINESVKDIYGWSPIEQLYSLYMLELFTQNLEGDIVEVGSWGGRSSIALALSAKDSGKSKVYAIDYFPNASDWAENEDGTYSFTLDLMNQIIPGHKQQTVWKEPFENSIQPFYNEHPNLLEYFKANINRCRLSEFVKPFRGNSGMFLESVPKDFKCRLVFIDGEHSYSAVKTDVVNFKKYLIPGGIICFDDAFTTYDGVDAAINEMIIESGEFHSFRKLTRKLFIAIKNTDECK